MKRKWTEHDIELLKLHYNTMPTDYLTKLLSRNMGTITWKAGTLNLGARKTGITKNTGSYRNKEKLDIIADKFIALDSPEHLYVLGFIWADGHIMRVNKRNYINIEIISDDMNNIRHTLENTGNWTFTSRHQNNRKPRSNAHLGNRKLVNFLFENNYENKSKSSPVLLEKIPKHLQKYFLRGWIDGDGCFYSKDRTSQFTLAGSYKQDWSVIEKYFNDKNIRHKTSSKISTLGHGCSYVRLSNQIDIIKLGNLIYENTYDGIGLERKFNKYLEIKTKPPRYSLKV